MTAEQVRARARAVCSEELPDTVNGVKSFDLHPESMTLADLDPVLGARSQLPRMPYADVVYAYPVVEVAGAPYGCTVFAAVTRDGRISRVTFRQEPR
jgi:hypothetical protein